MSKRDWIPFAAILPPAGLLWIWSASIKGSLTSVVLYSIAGAATGILLGTTGRAFASASLDPAAIRASGVLGFLILTPLLAVLMTDATDIVSASVVLLVSSIGIAAIAGALWSVIGQMGEAFDEWRHTHRLTHGGAHR